MTLSTPLKFKGAPGSPYTRKMLAVLRYRRIPYQLLVNDTAGMPEPKVGLLPTFYLENDAGELEAHVDSTPLIRRFEGEFTERSIIPDDPVLAFINYLIEDYGDEWLTKAMFHYRWYYQADIDKAGLILPQWRNLNAPAAQINRMAEVVRERQISRLYVVGSNDTTAPVIEDSYHRFLDIFDSIVARQTFLLGSRPASGDFAFYAQLTQLARFDPTPSAICLAESPRVYAWTDIVDDLSGQGEGEWLSREEAKSGLAELFAEIGRVYVPSMLANARALMQGEKEMETTIDSQPWVQPTFAYQGKCLEWVRAEYAGLTNDDRAAVDYILSGSGCEALFEGL